jgi:hypothetical protein
MAAKSKVLDYSGVKDGSGNFRPRRKPEGDYHAVIDSVDDHESSQGNSGWVFTIRVNGDPRASYPYYVNFETNQLWKSRGLCIAAGIKVPSGKVKLDPNKLVGKSIGVALVDDEYEGRVKSTIDAVFPSDDMTDALNQAKSTSSKAKAKAAVDEDEDEDEDEEELTPRKAKASKTKASKKPVDDDDEDDDDVDTDADDEDDEPPAKKKSPTKGKSKKARVDDDEDEDEDDDEEEEPPAKKSKKAPSEKKGKRKPVEDDEDDELDLDQL